MAKKTNKASIYSELKSFAVPGPFAASAFARVLENQNVLTVDSSGVQSCREAFHAHNTQMRLMCMGHDSYQGPNIAAFIRKIELKMQHTRLSEIGPTNRRTVSWIRPAAFWDRNNTRRSLFTILLRAGMLYEPDTDNFDRALVGTTHASGTKIAIDRFLSGYTWYRGTSSQLWYDNFSSATAVTVKKLLTKRPIKQQQLLAYACKKMKLTKGGLEKLYREEHHPINRIMEDE